MFNPTHIHRPQARHLSPVPCEVVSVDACLAVIRRPVNAYWEAPRYGTEVVLTEEVVEVDVLEHHDDGDAVGHMMGRNV